MKNQVKTHDFRDSFISGEAFGYVLNLESHRKPSDDGPAYVRQKIDDVSVCMFVFQSESAAKRESEAYPVSVKTSIRKITEEDIRSFIAEVELQMATKVILRDDSGAFALLDSDET